MFLGYSPIVLLMPFAMGALSAYLAHKRGKNPYLWLFLGFLFGIIGVFAIFFITQNREKEEEKEPLPIVTLQGPVDKLWYYLDPNKQQQGPMSRDALLAAWKDNKLNLSTFVWHEDLPEWKALQELIK